MAEEKNYYLRKEKAQNKFGCHCNKDMWCSDCLPYRVGGRLYSSDKVDYNIAKEASKLPNQHPNYGRS